VIIKIFSSKFGSMSNGFVVCCNMQPRGLVPAVDVPGVSYEAHKLFFSFSTALKSERKILLYVATYKRQKDSNWCR